MKNKILFFLNYVLGYLLYTVSAFVSLKGHNSLGIILLQLSFLFRISISLYLIIGKKRICDIKFHAQYLVIEFIIGIFYLSALLSTQNNKDYKSIIVMMGICLSLSLIYELSYIKEMINRKYINKIISAKELSILIVCAIFIVLAIPTIKTSYMWDSEIYVRKIVTEASLYNFTFSGIANAVRSHFQLGFDFVYMLFYYLFASNGNFIILGNIINGVITIYIFGKIILFILPNISTGVYIYSNLIFALSPLFLGTIGGINLDFAMMCFFIWFVYAYIKKYYVFQLFFGLLLCFSKEPGVILGASFIGFFILIEYVFAIKACISKKLKIKNLFNFTSIKKKLIDIIPFVVFVCFFIFKGNSVWTASSSVDDDYIMHAFGYIGSGYIIEKLKGIFLLNYSWIMWIIILILIIVVCYRKTVMLNKSYILSLGFSFVCYGIFNCSYITYLHPRYIVANVFIISILLIYFTNYAFKCDLYKKITLLIVSFLLLTQSFFNADLMTKRVYGSIPIGNGELISTRYFDRYLYSDANIYNRQYIYWQYSLIKFLDEVKYTEKDLLIFPDIEYQGKDGFSRYSILGLWKEETDLFYNPVSKRIDNFYEKGSQKLQTFFYNKESLDIDMQDIERIYYVDIGILDNKKDTTEAFLNKYNYISKNEYTTLSWKIIIYTIRK